MRNPDGAVEKRGRNLYRARITIRGKAYSKTWPTKLQADEWLRSLRTASDDDGIEHRRKVEQIGFTQLLKEFMTEVVEKRDGADSRRRERERCQFLLDKQPELSGMKAAQVEPRHITDYVRRRRKQGASNGSIRAELAIVRRMYNLAGGPWGYGFDQPVRPGMMPKPPPARERRLLPDEYERLVRAAFEYENAVGGQDRIPIGIIIEMAIYTAMRRGELASLTWDRVEIFSDGFGVATLTQLRTKSKKARQVPLVPDLVAMLLTLPSAKERQGSVFQTTAASIGTAWSRVRQAAGLYLTKAELKALREAQPKQDHGLRLHDLRHEGTTRLFEIYGLSKALVQAVTGHSSESMADRYTHLDSRPMLLAVMRQHHAPRPIEGAAVPGQEPKPVRELVRPELPVRAQVIDGTLISPEWKALKKDAKALKKAIWAQTIETLADAMGVSDVAIHKAAKKLKIEKPPRGYWLRGTQTANDENLPAEETTATG
ncbi:hypothetical protein D0B54_21260 [Solimonas sp. K1W22B-7]|uniref:tyrosine-type recombinase/integrase n=1 Tax=Solimonas sp. K1W22B-7 TaxID=2303331 RepID=UPI000E334378|nr:tyrosine-type recombinase/integrase [Solimonas sp. K1W22B-7]AXQ31051.1 hypothetical protein D0B54_21260 [Solimonas sp. K1W22B-7]